jgi:hypothetical protein
MAGKRADTALAVTLKRVEDPRVEQYEFEMTISDAEKQQFLGDMAALMTNALTKNGHAVNRMLVTTDFEKKASEAVGQSRPGAPVTLRGGYYHIAWPEKSSWI